MVSLVDELVALTFLKAHSQMTFYRSIEKTFNSRSVLNTYISKIDPYKLKTSGRS